MQRSIGESIDSYPPDDEIDIRDVMIKSRSSLIPPKGPTKPPCYPEKDTEMVSKPSYDSENDSEIVFLGPIEYSSSAELNSLAGSQVDSVVTGDYLTVTDSDNDEDIEVEAEKNQNREGIIQNVDWKENETVDDYDHGNDKDNNIPIEVSVEEDYESDFDDRKDSPLHKEISLCAELDDKIVNNGMFASWSMPSGTQI